MSTGFLCDALYRGCRLIQGSLSPALLASLADEDQQRDIARHNRMGQNKILVKMSSGDRCQLNIDDQNLKVCAVKKDEGFESDSESSSSLSSITTSPANVAKETNQGSQPVKSTFDHVLRLDKLIGTDRGLERFESIDSACSRVESDSAGSDDGCGLSTSLSSSGTESEEEVHNGDPLQSAVRKTTKNLLRENEGGENFSMRDIIFCHVVPDRPKVLIIVVKSGDSNNMNAIIFECISQQAAQGLYSQYYIASNKQKLNRNRFTKRKSPPRRPEEIKQDNSKQNEGEDRSPVVPKSKNAKPESRKKRIVMNGPPQIFENDFSLQETKDKKKKVDKFEADIRANLKNVNVIEVKDDNFGMRKPAAMMQRVDENGVTHIEIESGPYSMLDSSVGGPNQLVSITQSNDLMSALDRLSIHSYNNPDSYLNNIGDSRSCPNSLIQTTKEILEYNEKERKSRQRQPPMLIKDGNLRKSLGPGPKKENRQKVDRRNRSRSEDKKSRETKPEITDTDAMWNNHNNNFHHEHEPVIHQIPRADYPKSGESNFQSDLTAPRSLYEGDLKGQERPSRSRASSRSKEVVNRPPSGQNGRRGKLHLLHLEDTLMTHHCF